MKSCEKSKKKKAHFLTNLSYFMFLKGSLKLRIYLTLHATGIELRGFFAEVSEKIVINTNGCKNYNIDQNELKLGLFILSLIHI